MNQPWQPSALSFGTQRPKDKAEGCHSLFSNFYNIEKASQRHLFYVLRTGTRLFWWVAG